MTVKRVRSQQKRREHGAITVFLSIIMAIIIAFMGMLVDIARIRVAEAQLNRASQLAVDAMLTQYSRKLREDYGLFGYAGDDPAKMYKEYLIANFEPDAKEEQGEFKKLLTTFTGSDDPAYGDVIGLTEDGGQTAGTGMNALSDPEVLFQQVIEFSKYRVPLHMALNNNLNKLTELKQEIENIDKEMQVVKETSKLGKPMQEYAGMQKELKEALESVAESFKDVQDGIIEWNEFLRGEDKKASDRIETTVYYNEYYANIVKYGAGEYVVEWENEEVEIEYPISDYFRGDEYYYLESDRYTTRTAELDISLDAIFYNTHRIFRALDGARDEVAGLADKATEDLDDLTYCIDSLRNQWETVEQHLKDAGAEPEEYSDYTEIVEELRKYKQENPSDIVDQQMLQDSFELLVKGFGEAQEKETRERDAELYSDFLSLMNDISGALTVINDMKAQAVTVENTAKGINDYVNENLEHSEENPNSTVMSWQEDKEKTENTLKEDGKKLDSLKKSLEDLSSMITNQYVGNRGDAKVISDIMMNGISEMFNTKQAYTQLYSKVESIENRIEEYTYPELSGALLPGYEPYEPDDGKAESGKKELKKQQEAAEEDRKAEEQKLNDKETRFNKDEIPGKYKDFFIGASTVNEEKPELDDDVSKVDGNAKAEDADRKVGGNSSLLESVADKVNEGLQHTLGSVYASEYILNMFSNAAPQQEKNTHNIDTFEYARVLTLCNTEPVGAERYAAINKGTVKHSDDIDLRLGYFYNAEVEYILFGKDKEKDNADSAKVMLNIVLFGSNYLQVMNHKDLKNSVTLVADALMAAFGVPSIVTKILLFSALAVTETTQDIRYLMMGYEIPAFSRNGQKLFMVNLDDPNSVLGAQGEFMMSYEFYLQLRLMVALITSRDAVMQRMANLITLNIHYAADMAGELGCATYDSDKKFTMKNAFTSVSGTAAAKMPYWFMTRAIMGVNQAKDGWYHLKEQKIIASY